MKIRKAYDKHERFTTDPEGPSMAKQSMAAECDINKIMARYQKTGLISHLSRGQPLYIDVSEVPDYRTALHQVQLVGEFFAGLPAEVRAEFRNDPAEFLDFASAPDRLLEEDPDRYERMVEYGLAQDYPVEDADEARDKTDPKKDQKTSASGAEASEAEST